MRNPDKAGPGEIGKHGRPTVLFGDDVVGLEAHRRELLREPAILAAGPRPLAHACLQRRRHSAHAWGTRCFSAWRALEWRMPRRQPSFSYVSSRSSSAAVSVPARALASNSLMVACSRAEKRTPSKARAAVGESSRSNSTARSQIPASRAIVEDGAFMPEFYRGMASAGSQFRETSIDSGHPSVLQSRQQLQHVPDRPLY